MSTPIVTEFDPGTQVWTTIDYARQQAAALLAAADRAEEGK